MSSLPYKAERTPFGEKRGSSSENVLTTPTKRRRSTTIGKRESLVLPLGTPSPPRKVRSSHIPIRSSKSTPSLKEPPTGPLPPLPPGAAAAAVDPKIVFEKERFLNRHSRDFGYLHEAARHKELDADEAEAEAERKRMEKLRQEGREKRRSLVISGGILGLTSPTSPEVAPPRIQGRRIRPLSLVASRPDSMAESSRHSKSGSISAPAHLRQFSLSSHRSSLAYAAAPEDFEQTPKTRSLSLLSLTPPRSRTSGLSSTSDNTTSRGGCSDYSGDSNELRVAAQYFSTGQASTEEEQEMMRRRAIAIARTSRRLGGVSTTNADGRKWENSDVNERAKSLYRQSDVSLDNPEASTSAQDAYENPRMFRHSHRRQPSVGSYPLGANNTSATRKRYSQVRREADARRISDVETFRSSGSSASIATSGGIARGRELLLAAAGLQTQHAEEDREEIISSLPTFAHPRGPLRYAKASEASTVSVPFSANFASPDRPWNMAQSSGDNTRTLRRVKRLDDHDDSHGIRISLFSSGSEASHNGFQASMTAVRSDMSGVREEDDTTVTPDNGLSPMSQPGSHHSSSPGDETEVWRGMTSTEMGRRLFWAGGDEQEQTVQPLSRVNTLRNVSNDVGLGLGISSSSSFTAAIASSASIAVAADAAAKPSLLASPLLDTPQRSPIAPAPLGTLVHDGTDGASPGKPVRQTQGWSDGVKGWLRGTKEKQAGEGEIERGFGDGRVGEEGERTPSSTKTTSTGWKSFVGVGREHLTQSPSKKKRSSVPSRVLARKSIASTSSPTLQTLPLAVRHVSNPERIAEMAALTSPPVPHLPSPYSPSSASSSSPLTPRFVESHLPKAQILHQPSATSMRSMQPIMAPSISSPGQFAAHFAAAHSYSPTAQTPEMTSSHTHSPEARGHPTHGQVLMFDDNVRVPRMSPPPLGKRSKQSAEHQVMHVPSGMQDGVRIQRLAVPSPSFVGLGFRSDSPKYDFLKDQSLAQAMPRAKLRDLPSPAFSDPHTLSLPSSPHPDFASDFGTPPVSASRSLSFAEEQTLLPLSILRKRLHESEHLTPDVRPAIGLRTASQDSAGSGRSSVAESIENFEVLPATVLFILGFFFGPCESLVLRSQLTYRVLAHRRLVTFTHWVRCPISQHGIPSLGSSTSSSVHSPLPHNDIHDIVAVAATRPLARQSPQVGTSKSLGCHHLWFSLDSRLHRGFCRHRCGSLTPQRK